MHYLLRKLYFNALSIAMEEGELTEFKSKGFLCHPEKSMFHFLRELEDVYMKHASGHFRSHDRYASHLIVANTEKKLLHKQYILHRNEGQAILPTRGEKLQEAMRSEKKRTAAPSTLTAFSIVF